MNRQMLYLFISSFSILCVGFGLFPLLPVYATQFGATPTTIGVYLALTYISITLGSMLAGWLSGRVSRRLVLVVAGLSGALALALLGRATGIWQIILLTGHVWFTGGIGLANIDILTGLHAKRAERGRSFSWIALTNPLGAILGSLVVGQLVEWSGYPIMFNVMAVEYAIWPVVAFFFLAEGPAAPSVADRPMRAAAASSNRAFHFLLLSLLLSAMSISVHRLGLSLTMKELNYSAGAISGANVIGGLVTIPIVLWFGKLSDHLGRKLFLFLGYLLATVGGLTLALSNGELWNFWLVAATTLIARSVSASLAAALATDILPPAALGRSLPWVHSVSWIAGVIGFALSGVVIDWMGSTSLFFIAAGFSIASIGLATALPGSIPALKAPSILWKKPAAAPAPCGASNVTPC